MTTPQAPEALTDELARIIKDNWGGTYSAIATAILSDERFLAALSLRTTGEAVAWRWRVRPEERWYMADEPPSFASYDIPRIVGPFPLFTHPPAPQPEVKALKALQKIAGGHIDGAADLAITGNWKELFLRAQRIAQETLVGGGA